MADAVFDITFQFAKDLRAPVYVKVTEDARQGIQVIEREHTKGSRAVSSSGIVTGSSTVKTIRRN